MGFTLKANRSLHFRNDLSIIRNNFKNSFVRRAFFSLIISKSLVNRFQECHYCYSISTNVIRIQMYRLENNSLYMRILLGMPWVGRCTVACIYKNTKKKSWQLLFRLSGTLSAKVLIKSGTCLEYIWIPETHNKSSSICGIQTNRL